jgi:hypothetical protein
MNFFIVNNESILKIFLENTMPIIWQLGISMDKFPSGLLIIKEAITFN